MKRGIKEIEVDEDEGKKGKGVWDWNCAIEDGWKEWKDGVAALLCIFFFVSLVCLKAFLRVPR